MDQLDGAGLGLEQQRCRLQWRRRIGTGLLRASELEMALLLFGGDAGLGWWRGLMASEASVIVMGSQRLLWVRGTRAVSLPTKLTRPEQPRNLGTNVLLNELWDLSNSQVCKCRFSAHISDSRPIVRCLRIKDFSVVHGMSRTMICNRIFILQLLLVRKIDCEK